MWMKIDDRLHAHRKTRVLTRSHPQKDRDSAPMGLWVLAGSWASQNATDGWVPEAELDRWDDDWSTLTTRLIRSGYWWPEERDGEPGYGFNDWQEWNAMGAAASGAFGNHVRWHVQKGVVKPDCEHCPTEPDEPDMPESSQDLSGRLAPDSHPMIAPESGPPIGATRLPDPIPTRSRPDPEDKPRAKARATEQPDRFDEFWETYSHKVGRKKAETAYRAALRKPGVTADLLIAAAAAYITWQISEGKHPKFTKHPATWLTGEHWADERPGRLRPKTRVQEHLSLVEQLAAEEAATIHEIGQRR
jgi:hypothetical protein